ncbi:MAG: hypothetical protein Q8Q49_06110 [bacterium]|nr:hypothetical protein [bacterium]
MTTKFLYNKVVENHNVDSKWEGLYRVKDFSETVTAEEIREVLPLAEQYTLQTHSSRHVRKVRGACRSRSEMAEASLTPSSFDAMMASVVLSIIASQENAFAVTRPPGHHASKEKANGFCFFNNIAIASTYLLQMGKRVCIIDIDGHHGNGTQAIFRKEPQVMFCSIHQGQTYPYSDLPSNTTGRGNTERIINAPLLHGTSDDVFLEALHFILERARLFNPDHVAVSAGFDGYREDKILDLEYSKRGYFEAGKVLAILNKPIFFVLEGGYHSEVAECAKAMLAGVDGKKLAIKEQIGVSPPECLRYAKRFWR